MTIGAVMTKRVLMFPNTMSIRRVALLLFQHGLSGAPVVDEHDHLVGMISEKDIFKAIYPSYEEFYGKQSLAEFLNSQDVETRAHEIADLPVEQLMKRQVISCEVEDSIIRVGALMLAHGIHRLPVLEEDRLIGIVDRQDIFHRILEKEFQFSEPKQQKTKPPVAVAK